MEFRLNKEKKPELILKSNNIDLYDRWVLHNAGYFMKHETGNTIKAFVDAKPKDKRLQKTRLALCEDEFLERTVLAKTVFYTKDELDSEEKIREKRKFLETQIEILNTLRSSMLPEPLDYFEITNDVDEFGEDVSVELKKKEPVLILDYIPG
ncbi:MAG: hypothetical protein IKV59_07925, partial [Lachnospiraceae bacterium]|nr:hypothetical protein [Lachnospiraceae bacterium]